MGFSTVLFNILSKIKYYPYQTILYKIEISSYLQNKGIVSSIPTSLSTTPKEEKKSEVTPIIPTNEEKTEPLVSPVEPETPSQTG